MKHTRLCLRLGCFCLMSVLLLTACGAREISNSILNQPSPSPAAAEPTPQPTPAPELYECTVGDTYCYSAPTGAQEDLLGYIPQGTQAGFLDEKDGYILLSLPGGMEVWCSAWMLDPLDQDLKKQRDLAYLRQHTEREGFYSLEERMPVRYCILDGLDCRLEPGTEGAVVYKLSAGTALPVYGRQGDYYLCKLPNGKIVYAPCTYLCVTDRFSMAENAVDLREWLPEAEFEILFASPNNITGHAMYDPIPMMEITTANMLLQAYEKFRSDGYIIKVYDAYRPKRAQFQLYDIVQDNKYIANPYTGNSWHQFGRAIDMSLINLETGQELVMPTTMHTFNSMANRYSRDQWTQEAAANVDYMTDVMVSFGFGYISTEWWHFELNRDTGFYLPNDMDLDQLPTRMAY